MFELDFVDNLKCAGAAWRTALAVDWFLHTAQSELSKAALPLAKNNPWSRVKEHSRYSQTSAFDPDDSYFHSNADDWICLFLCMHRSMWSQKILGSSFIGFKLGSVFRRFLLKFLWSSWYGIQTVQYSCCYEKFRIRELRENLVTWFVLVRIRKQNPCDLSAVLLLLGTFTSEKTLETLWSTDLVFLLLRSWNPCVGHLGIRAITKNQNARPLLCSLAMRNQKFWDLPAWSCCYSGSTFTTDKNLKSLWIFWYYCCYGRFEFLCFPGHSWFKKIETLVISLVFRSCR